MGEESVYGFIEAVCFGMADYLCVLPLVGVEGDVGWDTFFLCSAEADDDFDFCRFCRGRDVATVEYRCDGPCFHCRKVLWCGTGCGTDGVFVYRRCNFVQRCVTLCNIAPVFFNGCNWVKIKGFIGFYPCFQGVPHIWDGLLCGGFWSRNRVSAKTLKDKGFGGVEGDLYRKWAVFEGFGVGSLFYGFT